MKAATTYDKKGVLKILLQHNVDVNVVNLDDRTTVLTEAVFHGYKDMVELLLQNSADPNADTLPGRSALIWAVKRGHTEIGKSIF